MLGIHLDAGANPILKESPFIAAAVGNLEAVGFLLAIPGIDFLAIPVSYLRITDSYRQSGSHPNANGNLLLRIRTHH
jgi:hypothetical protein